MQQNDLLEIFFTLLRFGSWILVAEALGDMSFLTPECFASTFKYSLTGAEKKNTFSADGFAHDRMPFLSTQQSD